MRIICGVCEGNGILTLDVAAILPGDARIGASALVTSGCRACGSTGWLEHPGRWIMPPPREVVPPTV